MERLMAHWGFGLIVGVLLSNVGMSQKAESPSALTSSAATAIFGGDSDHWLRALIESQDRTDTSVYLDRLAYFHLSANQLDLLVKSASQENSDEKRVILWHAIRQSRDTKSREQLIKILVGESSVDEQVEFLEQMQNISKSDIPILSALYNSQRPKKRKSPRSPGENDITPLDDLQNVPQRIVEMACHTDWGSAVTMTGFNYPGDKRQEDQTKWGESMNRRRFEAWSAQEEFLWWLIKNGFNDDHQIKAFLAFSSFSTARDRNKVYANVERELIAGMDSPESVAKVLPLVQTRVEPARYLHPKEAEIVRLAAIEAMERKIMYAFSRQAVLSYWDIIALYRPILESIADSDPSPQVKSNAIRLINRIAETEVEYGKAVGRAR